jgi:hypothetical protein
MVDIDQVMRRWSAGEGIRSIGRATGFDRNTVRRIMRMAVKSWVQRETAWPDQAASDSGGDGSAWCAGGYQRS